MNEEERCTCTYVDSVERNERVPARDCPVHRVLDFMQRGARAQAAVDALAGNPKRTLIGVAPPATAGGCGHVPRPGICFGCRETLEHG